MNRLLIEFWVPEDVTIPDHITIRPDCIVAERTGEVISDERLQQIADGNGQRAHAQTVRDIVASLIDEITDGTIQDEDAANDWLHQTVDGHHDVIYTACAKDVLRYSDHEDALQDEYGADELVKDGNLNWSGMAYAALLADVHAELDGSLAGYFECKECHYSVAGDECTRDADGLPTCADCAEPTVIHTSCKHCQQDIEGVAPFEPGQWRDRGNNTHCPNAAGDAGQLHESTEDATEDVPLVHWRSVRMFVNAGMDYPACRANDALLDTELRVPTSGDQALVTCQHCRELIEDEDKIEDEDSRSAESI